MEQKFPFPVGFIGRDNVEGGGSRREGSVMVARVYSENKHAAWIFADVLNAIARRGWFMAGPSVDDGQSLLYASFHVHPEDADFVDDIMKRGIMNYGGRTTWVLDRRQHNRFYLCPAQLRLKARDLENIRRAEMEIRRELPSLERNAASDLILLSDFLYKSYVESKT